MNEVKVFESKAFGKVRIIARDCEPWFVATNVCGALDISNNRDAVKRLDDDEKDVASTDTLGGKQEVQIVSESGLYSLVPGSRRPEARLQALDHARGYPGHPPLRDVHGDGHGRGAAG